MIRKYLPRSVFAFFLLLGQQTHAQFYSYPVEYSHSTLTARELNGKDSSLHTAVQPYIPAFSPKYRYINDTHRIFKYIKEDWALEMAFFDHVLDVKPRNTKVRLVVDPILNLQLISEFVGIKAVEKYGNCRGIVAAANLGEKVYVESFFTENQFYLPTHVSRWSDSLGVIPGAGRWKRFKIEEYDFAFSSGIVSVQALKNLNLQVGHGKHKIGHGYRSLFLSDNAFNYPFVKITQQFFKGRLQYNNIYSCLMNLTPASIKPSKLTEPLLQKKAASFQYLSINPTDFLSIGFFQGLIWQAGNSKNKQNFTYEYFNPLIFATAATRGLKDSCNVMVGAEMKIKLGKKVNLYGQLALDDPHTDTLGVKRGMGYQGGIRFFDVFRIRNLFFQAEYNYLQEDMYQSPAIARTDQSFSHYNQPIGFAPGSGEEMVFIANYQINRIHLMAKYNVQNVFWDGDPYYNTQVFNSEISYLINPSYNLNVSLCYIYRKQNFPNFKVSNNQTNFLCLALRTSLFNFYYDH